MASTTSKSYTRVAIALHWVMALLIIGQIAGGKVMHAMDPAPAKYELFQLHKSFGITILILSVARLIWRLTHRPPALPSGMKPFERLGAKLSHIGFYVFMIGTPIAGWILVSSTPQQITTKLFKTIIWPDFPGITRSEALSEQMSSVHEYMAIAIVILLALHIGAALKHHFVNRDDVLSRMIPAMKPKGEL